MQSPRLPAVLVRHPWITAAALGLGLTLFQIFLALLVQADFSPHGYRGLFRWDSLHYGRIVEKGYFNNLPPLIGDTDPSRASYQRNTNVAFFPGYIIAGRAVRAVTGFSIPFSLLLAAAIAAWGFWTELLLLLRHWNLSVWSRFAVTAAVLAHPTAFYLVAAYSESLFLLGIVGFFFWAQRGVACNAPTKFVPSGLLCAAAAIGHGIVMTATRIFGLPLCLYPVIVAALRRGKTPDLVRAGVIATGASLGALLFFLYSSVALGKWNLYMLTQVKQWGLVPDYLFFLHAPLNLWLPVPPPALFVNNAIGPVATSLTLWLLLAASAAEFFSGKHTGTRPQRIALLACAFMSLYVSLIALANAGMRSMVRYAFIPYVFIVLQLALLAREHAWTRGRRVIATGVIGAALVLLFVTQVILLDIFTSGGWVA